MSENVSVRGPSESEPDRVKSGETNRDVSILSTTEPAEAVEDFLRDDA